MEFTLIYYSFMKKLIWSQIKVIKLVKLNKVISIEVKSYGINCTNKNKIFKELIMIKY